jgi:4-hydroxy-tetrahydrodipicolinate synthase
MHEAWGRGDLAEMARARDLLMPLHRVLFLESSPTPVKYAASLLGKCAPDVRLPLVACGEGTRAAVRQAMTHAGLLN